MQEIPEFPYPEHLMPALRWQPVSRPITEREKSSDPRSCIDKLLDDQRRIFNWAQSEHLAVLSINADRNGAYACVAAQAALYKIFGDECAKVHERSENGVVLEYWIGLVGEIRVFWREVKCVH